MQFFQCAIVIYFIVSTLYSVLIHGNKYVEKHQFFRHSLIIIPHDLNTHHFVCWIWGIRLQLFHFITSFANILCLTKVVNVSKTLTWMSLGFVNDIFDFGVILKRKLYIYSYTDTDASFKVIIQLIFWKIIIYNVYIGVHYTW